MKKNISTDNMNTHTLHDLTKDQLIKLLLKQNLEIKVVPEKYETTA